MTTTIPTPTQYVFLFATAIFFSVSISLWSQQPQSPLPHAEGTNSHFYCTLETTAKPEEIWRLWTDVEHWSAWDTELESSSISGAFLAGTRGTLKPTSGSPAQFIIDECNDGSSYTFSTALPLGSLTIKRTLERTTGNGSTRFTHDVQFTGFSGWFFAMVLGNQYKTALPEVMNRIRTLAEKR
jgi:hypothetical protein